MRTWPVCGCVIKGERNLLRVIFLSCKRREIIPPYSPSVTAENFSCYFVIQLLSHVRLFVAHGLQHARLPCPSPSPRICSNSCPLSW